MGVTFETAERCDPKCDAKLVVGPGDGEPRYVCRHCGDVTDEDRCPHDTPKQSRSGLDI
jgi:hypothetical protein